MSSRAEFERQLLALDGSKLYEFLEATIGMYIEYVDVHGHEPERAIHSAINEMLDGAQAMIELDDSGDL
jgi:hypothetical protein